VKSSRPFVVQPNRSSLLVWIFLCFIVALMLALLIIQPVLAEKKITAAEAKDHVDKAATAHPLSEPVATPAPQVTPLTQDSTQKKAIKVWVNTNSGIYHCPGSRWYGKTKQGKYMSECEVLKAGYGAAYYRPCGSDCK
jgi:hypothetical protein